MHQGIKQVIMFVMTYAQKSLPPAEYVLGFMKVCSEVPVHGCAAAPVMMRVVLKLMSELRTAAVFEQLADFLPHICCLWETSQQQLTQTKMLGIEP